MGFLAKDGEKRRPQETRQKKTFVVKMAVRGKMGGNGVNGQETRLEERSRRKTAHVLSGSNCKT